MWITRYWPWAIPHVYPRDVVADRFVPAGKSITPHDCNFDEIASLRKTGDFCTCFLAYFDRKAVRD
jgi:hypothetical protein